MKGSGGGRLEGAKKKNKKWKVEADKDVKTWGNADMWEYRSIGDTKNLEQVE